MSAAATISDLEALGITLRLDCDTIRFRAKRGVMTREIRERIAADKGAIVAALSPPASGHWTGLLQPGTCTDCGGPAPRDGRHRCSTCAPGNGNV